MELNNLHKVYFLGIGGIGMSAIARFFNLRGVKVVGYDRVSTPLTQSLENEGITIHYDENPEYITKDTDLIVYTPAIPKTHKEWKTIEEFQIPTMKRAAVLGLVASGMKTIAIAGTHGKTTITSMVTHLLIEGGIPVSAFIGGIANNFNSNFVLNADANVMVVEADEFDRSFLHLHPDIAIVNSMDADHLDIYGAKEELELTFKAFVNQIKSGGCLISRKDLCIESDKKEISYSAHGDADFCISDLQVENGEFLFTIQAGDDHFEDVHFGMPGRHNVENMLAAIAVAYEMGIKKEDIVKAVASYKGVKRRFDIKYKGEDSIYIDDYAHHPEELRACISAVKELYPGKRISGVFQPHLFSRTQDFAKEFAQSLEMLDDVILLEIYPARELPIEGVNSEMLLNLINKESKFLWTKGEVIDKIGEFGADVYLTLGAGDIDTLVEPLSNNFKAGKYEKNN